MSMTSAENPNGLPSLSDERSVPQIFPRSLSTISVSHPLKTLMTDKDLKNILSGVQTALEAFEKNAGKLNALEISLKSMLMVVEAQVESELGLEAVPPPQGALDETNPQAAV